MAKIVRKAVIPVAGLGTRFLPATKTVPKELLPIVDRPILLYIVEEAVAAGIEQIILVSGRGKGAIEDFFDTSFEVESLLEKTGKTELLNELRRIRSLCEVISIRQKSALGLGHAVGVAKSVVGDEPFALLLGDEIMVHKAPNSSAIGQLIHEFQESQQSTVAVMKVPKEDASKYGMVRVPDENMKLMKISEVIEKPSPEAAPSQWALPGRYVFTPKIFSFLETIRPGRNGEIQLTDAMTLIAENEGLWGMPVEAERFDAGDKLGYLIANIEMALRRDDLGPALTQYLKDRI